MKLTFILLIASGIVFFYIDNASAGQVGDLNTFTANTPAVASQVNDNFNDVKNAVNDNDNRITTNASNIEGKQNRVTGSCPSGQSIRSINIDGTVSCEVDDIGSTGDITAVITGAGLSGGGDSGDVTISPDTTYLQRRVSACSAGYSIRSINEDGSVVCEFDDNSGGDIDGAIATHSSNADAHHTRYTDAEAVAANQSIVDSINTEIDTLSTFTSIAHAFINSDGTILSGTSNVTSCTWDANYERYEITISGEDYYVYNYVTVVTPTSNDYPFFANTDSIGGRLLVYLYDIYEVPYQGSFQFVTFKP